MKNELEQKIEEAKKIIELLPINNKENRQKKKDYILDETINNNVLLDIINKEMDKRVKVLDDLKTNPDIKKLEDELVKCNIENEWNIYNTSYEKMHLDYYLYQLNKYYKEDLDSLNGCIKRILKSFNKVGIIIKKEDFNFHPNVAIYMDNILNNKSNEELKKSFEDLYWKFPEMIKTIEVNFKSIYLKNEKRIDKYYESRHIEFLKEHSEEELEELKHNISNNIKYLKAHDPYFNFQKIINKEFNVSDFNETDIDKKKTLYFKENVYSKELLLKLDQILFEYNILLKYSYLLKDMRELIEKKDTLKNSKINALKEITKDEKSLIKLNISQTKHGLFKKKNDEKLLFKYKELLESIISKYEEFDNNSLYDMINTKLSSDTTVLEVLKFISANYLYYASKTKLKDETLTNDIISSSYKEFKNEINYNDFILLNNIMLLDEKPMKEIIVNKCNLDGINITIESLEEDSLEKTIRDIDILVEYENILDSGLKVDDIKFYLEVKKM